MVSHEPYHLDPEVDGLLREIAADPRSSLFKSARPRSPMSWAEYSEPISTWTPDLTSAEKQLLVVHRVELAHLLRDRWLIELQRRPSGHLNIVAGDGSDAATRHLSPVEWGRRIGRLSSDLLDETEASHLLGLLPSDRVLDEAAHASLVAFAMRLDPSNTSRIYLAQDLIRQKQYRAARSLLGKVVSSDPHGPLACFAWDGLGQVWNLEGRLDKARDLYLRSVHAEDSRASGLGGWLLLAAQTGARDATIHAASLIDDLGDWADPAFGALAQGTRRTRSSGSWFPTQQSQRLHQEIWDSVGPRARMVLDVFR